MDKFSCGFYNISFTYFLQLKIKLFCQQKSLINGISYRSVETIRRRLQSKIF